MIIVILCKWCNYYLCRVQISSPDQTAEASAAPPRLPLQSLQHCQEMSQKRHAQIKAVSNAVFTVL